MQLSSATSETYSMALCHCSSLLYKKQKIELEAGTKALRIHEQHNKQSNQIWRNLATQAKKLKSLAVLSSFIQYLQNFLNLDLLWQFFYAIGQIFIVVNGQKRSTIQPSGHTDDKRLFVAQDPEVGPIKIYFIYAVISTVTLPTLGKICRCKFYIVFTFQDRPQGKPQTYVQKSLYLANKLSVSRSTYNKVKSFLGNFYRHLAIFFWSHWTLLTSTSPPSERMVRRLWM